jgi:[acyl-carrier-protein] S-malonyltransferase
MMPAEERLEHDLDRLAFADLSAPVITNVDAEAVSTGSAARDALKRQPSRPVRWTEIVVRLLDSGADTFIEVGPGKVLTGLVRSVAKSVTMLNVEDDASMDQVLGALL